MKIPTNDHVKELFDKYVDLWLQKPKEYMWGVPLDLLGGEKAIPNLPNILKIRSDSYKSSMLSSPVFQVSVDANQFPFLYRGITGPAHFRVGRLGGGSINTDRPDTAVSPPMEKFILEYVCEGRLTGGYQGSKSDGVYFSSNPLVALSGDQSGPFATPDGMLFVVDPINLDTKETFRYMLDEVTCHNVPLENVHLVYVGESILPFAQRIGSDVKVHNFKPRALRKYREHMLHQLIQDTALNPESLFIPRYADQKSQERVQRGLSNLFRLKEKIDPLLFSPGFHDPKDTSLYGLKKVWSLKEPIKFYLLISDKRKFQEGMLGYLDEMKRERVSMGLGSYSPALDELQGCVFSEWGGGELNKQGFFQYPISEKELSIFRGENIFRELDSAFFN